MEDLQSLERLRQNLEDQIEKLRQSLRYWRTWEAEYEGFKEELTAIDHEPSTEEILKIGSEFGGDVIDEKEIKSLVGFSQATKRSRTQVVSALNGRIDTAQRNATTIQTEIGQLEERLEKIQLVAHPTPEGEDGEQLVEIREELDENGNVISSKVTNADQGADQIDAAVKKAEALDKLTPTEKAARLAPKTPIQPAKSPAAQPDVGAAEAPSILKRADVSKDAAPAKMVSFAETLKQIPPEASNAERWKLLEQDNVPNPVPVEGPRVLELDENDQVIGSRPLEHLPLSTEERARHQREVFENASMLGPVVATMDIEEDSDFDDDDEDMYDQSSESAEDNEFGMTAIRNEFTPEYIAEMQSLMKKHANIMANIGPRDAGFSLNEPLDSLEGNGASADKDTKVVRDDESDVVHHVGKAVRFVDGPTTSRAVDQPPRGQGANLPIRSKASTAGATLSDIVERKSAVSEGTARPTGGKKRISKFKAAKLEGEV